jgi:hypothetical protein
MVGAGGVNAGVAGGGAAAAGGCPSISSGITPSGPPGTRGRPSLIALTISADFHFEYLRFVSILASYSPNYLQRQKKKTRQNQTTILIVLVSNT